MTTNNPILDELHAVRTQMLADAGGTLAGLVAKIQADQAKSGRVILKTVDHNRMHLSDGRQQNLSGDSTPTAR